MKLRLTFLAFLIINLFVPMAWNPTITSLQAREFVPLGEDAASWSATPSKTTVKPGEEFTINIAASINKGWHIYSTKKMTEGPIATSFAITKSKIISFVGKPNQPKPISKFDDAFGINTELYEEDVTFIQKVKLKDDVKAGIYKVELGITFMACNDRLCLPPKTVKSEFTITVTGGQTGVSNDASKDITQSDIKSEKQNGKIDTTTTSTTSQKNITTPRQEKSALASGDARDVEEAKQKGFWTYIGLAMSVGLLSLLTPCVFPMIPITVSFFTKRPTITRRKGILDASIYSLGIIFTFTGLGILLAVTMGASGINKFAANEWINALIALIFILFALNLFGMFEIVIPSSLLTKLTSTSQQGSGFISLLLMGLTFTLTSFTCTVPFIGTVLVAASQGDFWWSIIGMLAFSTAFAFPFFLLALFPSWLKSLPKSGAWLNSVKVVMGFLELAAAMKFISNIDLRLQTGLLSRDLFLAVWIAIGIVTAIYLLGKIRLPHDTPSESIGVLRMMFSIFFIGISIFLYTGMNEKPLGELDAFLPPMHDQEWISDYSKALALSKKEGKPIFIDFTGFTCTNCRWMEANVFTRPEIKNLVKQFIKTRLFTDGQGEEYENNRAFQESRFGTVALPLYVIMSSDDHEIARFPGLTRNHEEFKQFLERGLSGINVALNNAETNL